MTKADFFLSPQGCLAQAARCISCGTCVTVCPVFEEDPREELTARGRNARMHSLQAAAERKGLMESMDKCLVCGRCAMVCPRGIPNDSIVASLRAQAARRHGLPLAKKAAFRILLTNRRRMGRALRLATMFQKLLPVTKDVSLGRSDSESLPPVRHLPLFFSRLAGGRHLPPLHETFLSERIAEVTPPASQAGSPLRVALFAGCAMEFALPNAAVSMVDLLSRLGMEVIVPRAQGCCGTPMHANGDMDTALAMARHNAEVLEACHADIIVTGCATCGSSLREVWPSLDATSEERARFAALAAKTRDFSEVLLARSFPEPFPFVSRLPTHARVTWHAPCHLVQHQKVNREPLALLKRVLGERFTPLPSRCCGFGGSFNVSHYAVSRAIGAQKARDVRASGAEYIVTACPGCMIQLSDMAAQHGVSGKVIHLAEAISLP
ncbi:(Fe-S)-binding protein [Desulfovibrio sp. SGI.169]|uniref:(Fe-S)-binding protein n=1 Tax=Desulfovibrio sp. SGI.169 TaxID=3420561 RepID=UPI003CFEDF24